ncbi:hypothetical protein F5I97DRAFT_1933136 [Phlebopus sp. FC_14]|nr:hypothetical protein F5I97DRAFT_1933136 [Phlebopus sp. FC_14]
MTRPTKRQKQAKRQRASGAKVFNSGFIEDLLEIAIDPDYQLDATSDSNEADSDTHSVTDMSFNLMDDSEIDEESTDSDGSSVQSVGESDEDIVYTGKRKIDQDFVEFEGEETSDYVENCIRHAAVSAHKFWADIISSEVFSMGQKPAKLPKHSMPSYTGTGRTRTYLRERELQQGAQNNKKITSFFAPLQSSVEAPILQHHEESLSTSAPTASPGSAVITVEPVTSTDKRQEESNDLESNRNTSHPTVESNTSSEPSVASFLDTVSDDDEAPNYTSSEPSVASFLDTVSDDDDAPNSGPVLEIVKTLIINAKKFKSFTPLFYLNSLKQFIELWEKYQRNPRIKAPMCKASHTVAVSVGKGPYMARKIHALYRYVARF